MPHVTADRILEQSSTSGTGAFTLAGAVPGFRRFAEVMSIGDTCDYSIEVPSGAWEVGTGTYSAVDMLTRTTVQASSEGGAAVDFASGAKRVMLGATAASFNAKAPLASPAFTGTPTAPTPAIGDSSTQLATTAFGWAMLGGVDVRRYGALLNGVADDRAAIQAAIDANPGKCIVIPKSARISGPVVVRSDGTRLVGMGSGVTTITNTGANSDAVVFEPAAGDYLNSCGLEGLKVYRGTDASAGAALKLRQCNGFTLSDFTGLNHPKGVVILGGKENLFQNLRLSVDTTISYASGSSLLRIAEADLGDGLYQTPYTCQFVNFSISGGPSTAERRIDHCIDIAAGDGVTFTGGYVNLGHTDLVRVQAQTDGQYISSLTFTGTYFDGAAMSGGTPTGIAIPSDGLSGPLVHSVTVDGCTLGNFSTNAVAAGTDIVNLTISDCWFVNVGEWAVSCGGSITSTYLAVTGCNFRDVGEVLTGTGAILATNGKSVRVIGNDFNAIGNTSNHCIALTGTFAAGVVSGNTFTDCSSDLFNSAAFTGGLTISGNATNHAIKTVAGVHPGNVAIADVNTLDWYEEGTWAPTLTFGGADTGNVYATQNGRYTRIGNRVLYEAYVQLTVKGSATGIAALTGIPFIANSSNTSPAALRLVSAVAGVGDTSCFGYIGPLGTGIQLRAVVAGSGLDAQLTNVHFASGAAIIVSGHYGV